MGCAPMGCEPIATQPLARLHVSSQTSAFVQGRLLAAIQQIAASGADARSLWRESLSLTHGAAVLLAFEV